LSITENSIRFRESIPDHVTLVAVSKTKPTSDIKEAYDAGQRIFGENKIQEMTQKWEQLPKDIQWHMIGHVQTNKVKYMIPYVSLIHSVDRLKLLKEIDKQADRWHRKVDVLLQVKIAKEDTKFGMPQEDLVSFFNENKVLQFPNINIKGLMGMASFTADVEQVTREFQQLKELFDRFDESQQLTILSMGMSADHQLAITQGSTMIRVGSAIFGSRNY